MKENKEQALKELRDSVSSNIGLLGALRRDNESLIWAVFIALMINIFTNSFFALVSFETWNVFAQSAVVVLSLAVCAFAVWRLLAGIKQYDTMQTKLIKMKWGDNFPPSFATEERYRLYKENKKDIHQPRE